MCNHYCIYCVYYCTSPKFQQIRFYSLPLRLEMFRER
jgi:hypothetical protein